MFEEVETLQLARASQSGDYIKLPYCYVHHEHYQKGKVVDMEILNSKKFADVISTQGGYQSVCYTQSGLERNEWIRKSIIQIKRLSQLINEYQKEDNLIATQLSEVL